MLHVSNKDTARDPIVREQARNVSESTPSSSRKMWRFWGGACFVIVLLAAFGQPLLGLANYAAHSSLHSYILLIPFVSGYLLYLRRDQLPKKRVADLPFGLPHPMLAAKAPQTRGDRGNKGRVVAEVFEREQISSEGCLSHRSR